MIQRWYAIICDTCGGADYYRGTLLLVEKHFRKNGGIITNDKQHYCGKDCYKKRRTNENE